MKKLFLSTLLLLGAAMSFAQNGNVVLFSEGGERFYAILNGQRMNEQPATNVKVEDLNQPGYKLKLIFEDKSLPDVSKDIMVAAGEEAVYMLKLDKKGTYKVTWRSSTPIAQAAPAPANQVVYHWGAPAVVNTNTNANTVNTNTVVVEETVTTTTTSTGVGTNVNTGTGENVSMNVNVDGFGLNVNINANDQIVTDNATVTTTTTTTTTTTGNADPNVQVIEPVASATPCAMMDNSGFESARSSIEARSMDDSKMTLAKQITKSNCLSANQVKAIMELFSFEETKLDFAKFAYLYCYEPNNYYLVNDAFTFESSIEELDAYISSVR